MKANFFVVIFSFFFFFFFFANFVAFTKPNGEPF